MTQQTPSVSIVVPVHNEAAYLERGLASLLDELHGVPAHCTVWLVENGSSDATLAIAERLASVRQDLHVLSFPEADYGGAMRAGFLRAEGDWTVNFDIDYFSGDFLRRALAVDADVVIGSKRAPGSVDRRSSFRRLATRTFNLLLRLLFGSQVSDTHGMKAFRASVVRQLGPLVISRQDLFDTELVLRAERAGFRIREVPVIVEERRAARSALFRRVPRTLRGLLQLRASLSMERRKTTSR